MKQWISKIWNRYQDLFWYCFFGGLTTIVNLVVYHIGTSLLGLHYAVANVMAWVLAVLFAYLTNRTWVFKSETKGIVGIAKEVISFFGFRVISLGMETLILFVMIDMFGVNEMLTKVIAQIFVVVSNYVFSKLIIFKQPETESSST